MSLKFFVFFSHYFVNFTASDCNTYPLKKLAIVFTSFLLTSFVLVSAQVQAPVEVKRSQEKTIVNGKIYYIHTVLKGQTLYSISKAYDISQDEIIRENPGLSATELKEGQALRIPSATNIQAAVYPQNREDFYEHRVKRGQTVYSIARKYDVDEEIIYQFNPWARAGIQQNQTIWIPRPKKTQVAAIPEETSGFLYHTVKEQETLYAISLIYGVSVSDLVDNNDFLRQGLKVGQILKIPRVPQAVAGQSPETDTLAALSNTCSPITDDQASYNVALLLPFFAQYNTEETAIPLDTIAEEGTYVVSQRQQGLRGKSFAEFYEGFLLAVDSLKNAGFSVKLHVYDTERDSMKTKRILKDLSLVQPDLIIGPVYAEDVRIASRLAQYKEINLVSPLSTRTSLMNHNSRIIQIIPTRESECQSLAEYLARFNKGQFVLVRGTDSVSMRNSWLFKKFLMEHMPVDGNNNPLVFHDYRLNDSLLNNLNKVLIQQDDNIVIVFSESEPDVSRLVSKLYMMSSLYPINLFGMPSWQVWKTIELNYFHSLHLHLISPFYVDHNNPEVKQFLSKCRKKYGYEPYETSALGFNFCMLGYDLGYYFLSALKTYGKDFQQCLNNLNTNMLLSPYRFVQDGQGGYINTGFNMVEYNPDYTISSYKLQGTGY
jgi:LysM repeat protein/ABC-type branched-subunit amino acid transport system substrate-binding protein